ncbi:MAG: FixG Ig-like domain-containing protein [Burkholderiaceae bacterium]
MNATESPQTYKISVRGLPGIAIASDAEITVLPTEVRSAVLRVQIPPNSSEPGSHGIHFDIQSTGGDVAKVSEKAAFLVPR